MAKRLKLPQAFVTKMERGDRRIDLMQLRTIRRLSGSTLSEFVAEFETEIKRSDKERASYIYIASEFPPEFFTAFILFQAS